MKLFLLGIDGATWHLLDDWLKEGELPNLLDLVKKGTSGILYSTVPTSTCPALPSMYTGMNPGNLGLFSYTKDAGKSVTMEDVEVPGIWDYLDDLELSSLVFNVRFTYPPSAVNGVMVSGTPVPSETSDYIYPKSLKKRLGGFQREEILLDELIEKPDWNRELILEKAKEITERRFEKMISLDPEKYDFVFYYIGNSDVIQHVLWDYPEMVLEYYKIVDSIVGDIEKRYENIPKIVFSDHGFHESARYRFHLNTLLCKEGYLVRKGGWLKQKLINLLQGVARDLIPPSLLSKKVEDKGSILVGRFDSFPGIDYKKSKSWLSELWGVRVEENMVDEVIQVLGDYKWNGKKVVKDIWRKKEIFQGKYLDEIPEVIFLTEEEFHTEAQLSSKVISRLRFRSKRKHAGEHTNAREGIYIFSEDYGDIGGLDIYDLLPIIFYTMELPVPEGVDGRLPEKRFKEAEYKRYKTIKKHGKETSDEEREKLTERLRALGYMD